MLKINRTLDLILKLSSQGWKKSNAVETIIEGKEMEVIKTRMVDIGGNVTAIMETTKWGPKTAERDD